MLIKVRYQDWESPFAYAPSTAEAVINTDHIISVKPCESRGAGPFVRVRMIDDQSLICIGRPSDFLPKENADERDA